MSFWNQANKTTQHRELGDCLSLYSYGDLSMTHELMQHEHTRNGLSDAGAHCGAICDGGMPTFLMTHWVRDRQRGPRLQLERMVQRQTRKTAKLYGLTDSGLIAPGLRADLNLIDFDALSFDMPKMVYDFPPQRPQARATCQGLCGHVCEWRADGGT